tara:strand:+ start:1113 stop:1799 length:687 start_codon:yes stop_codon:yes gene_type:complete
MKFKVINLMMIIFLSTNMLSSEIPPYSAKYNFESDEISISGIREFYKTENGFEMKFKASNLFASLFFLSKFEIKNSEVISDSYEIKIRPKFLDRDQYLNFDYENMEVRSEGINKWVTPLKDNLVHDPLNVQIMIRKNVKHGLKNFKINIVDMEEGGSKSYEFNVLGLEECIFNGKTLNCVLLERSRLNSDRKVTYYLAEELEHMFIKIIDTSPERTNTLKLLEVLSFG